MVKQKQLKIDAVPLFYFLIYNLYEIFKGLKKASLYYGLEKQFMHTPNITSNY
jgi:hypothetical protein